MTRSRCQGFAPKGGALAADATKARGPRPCNAARGGGLDRDTGWGAGLPGRLMTDTRGGGRRRGQSKRLLGEGARRRGAGGRASRPPCDLTSPADHCRAREAPVSACLNHSPLHGSNGTVWLGAVTSGINTLRGLLGVFDVWSGPLAPTGGWGLGDCLSGCGWNVPRRGRG